MAISLTESAANRVKTFLVSRGRGLGCLDNELANGVLVVGGVQAAGELGGVLAAVRERDQPVRGGLAV